MAEKTRMGVDMKNVNGVRLTCEELTVKNLELNLDMLRPADGTQPTATSSTAKTPMAMSTPALAKSQPLVARDHIKDNKYHLLLAASGSVATIKIPSIVQALSKHKFLSIRIILTESAAKFLQGQSDEQPSLEHLAKYPNVDAIYQDEDEWKTPWVRGAPILHIELRRWADMLVIAPLSANTLAKISNGLSDNLLTSVVRAWEVLPKETEAESNDDSSTEDLGSDAVSAQKRIIVAPAMNTAMWRHPLTAVHLKGLRQRDLYHWFDVMEPIEKELACGDSGDGAMCDWNKIVSVISVHIEMRKLRVR